MRRYIFIILFFLFSGLVNAKDAESMNYKVIASAETKIWQAYYSKDSTTLLEGLITYCSDLFGIKNPKSAQVVATKFANAAVKFGVMPENTTEKEYNETVLPLLIDAYQTVKQSINASWSPKEVAEADLSWWVARRQINTLEPEIVATKMVKLFNLLYGKNDNQHFIRAAYLRSVAGRYRDQCQDKWGGINITDWKVINTLLKKSYLELAQGIEAN